MVVWRYALLPLVCLLLALTHSLVGLTNLVLAVWRVGDGLDGGLIRISVRDLLNSSRRMDMKNKAILMGCGKRIGH